MKQTSVNCQSNQLSEYSFRGSFLLFSRDGRGSRVSLDAKTYRQSKPPVTEKRKPQPVDCVFAKCHNLQ